MIFASITIPIIMSEQSEPSTRPTRAKKKKCEDKIIRDILKLKRDLITEHNTASSLFHPNTDNCNLGLPMLLTSLKLILQMMKSGRRL